jgi:hypothetical protein
MGGKAKSIRVVRLAHRGNSPTPGELRATIEKIWQGTFQAGFCQIAWAEYEGKSWFFRLYPAAQ